MGSLSAAVLLVCAGVVLPATVAGAATFTVSNANASGPGSIAQAVADAVANPGDDDIVFAPATDGVTLPEINIDGTGADLIRVIGNGEGITITGQEIDLNAGFGAETNVEISGLSAPAIDASAGFDGKLRATFTKVFVSGPGDIDNNATCGGDLEVTYSSVVFEDGGEFGFSTLGACPATITGLIEDSTIKENADNGLDLRGDGISVTVVRSTLANNAGGAFIFDGELQMVNSTITTSESPGVRQFGGAVTLRNVTIHGNELGGIEGPGTEARSAAEVPGEGTATVVNSIVAGNGDRSDCTNVNLVSLGGNVFGDDSCTPAGPGDQASTDPRLGPLADNGGPTLTFLPADDSPAIDVAVGAECPDVDQRGFSRAVAVSVDDSESSTCDSGAVEVGAEVPTSPSTSTPPIVDPGYGCGSNPEMCETKGGSTVSDGRTDELPRTGSPTGAFVFLGGTLVAVGLALVGSARRRRSGA